MKNGSKGIHGEFYKNIRPEKIDAGFQKCRTLSQLIRGKNNFCQTRSNLTEQIISRVYLDVGQVLIPRISMKQFPGSVKKILSKSENDGQKNRPKSTKLFFSQHSFDFP